MNWFFKGKRVPVRKIGLKKQVLSAIHCSLTQEKSIFVFCNSQKEQKNSVSKEESQFFPHLFSDKVYPGTFWCDKQFQENRLLSTSFYLSSQATLSSFTRSPLRILSCYLSQSYWLFSISSWSSPTDLGSLSHTHGLSNFLAFLQ